MPELDPNRTPGTVVGAVAAGTVVVPFLVVYSFLFITRGIFVQVEQPDITSSRSGEAMAGFVAVIYLALVVVGMGRFLNGRARLPFLIGQLITAAICLGFILDTASGQSEVPAVVLLASLIAITLTFVPTSWQWVQTARGTEPIPAKPIPSDRPAASEDEVFEGRPASEDISGIDHLLRPDQG
ncbi:MAG TPA: hypothetical protein VGH11_19505 [Jatrophihabitans sp.]|jgi:hypothetical protein